MPESPQRKPRPSEGEVKCYLVRLPRLFALLFKPCLSREIVGSRLGPKRSLRRVCPTGLTPFRFPLRKDSAWLPLESSPTFKTRAFNSAYRRRAASDVPGSTCDD